MAGADDRFERSASKLFREQDLDFEELSVADAAKRYPRVNFQGVKWVLFEKNAGYLLARQACQAVLEMFQKEGGQYIQLAVLSPVDVSGDMRQIDLSDASPISADQYVFACGPWLGKLFPDVIGDLIKPTRQEVFFFGTPAGDSSFSEAKLPSWSDGDSNFYGIPANERRGFKIASHRQGPLFDPTKGDRMPTAEGLQNVRNFLELRFPSLKTAPLLEARVCQYENTPDENFVIDRHPRARNLWLVGGGSGHGFKHGPAVGEWVSDFVLEKKAPDRFFSLARFHKGT
ncbi:MAG TPA: FAD-dependent oxidoreductase [Acidobacteriota bacterium]|jgi:glycine/D-amino acid oxidase-like deaminating enzyme